MRAQRVCMGNSHNVACRLQPPPRSLTSLVSASDVVRCLYHLILMSVSLFAPPSAKHARGSKPATDEARYPRELRQLAMPPGRLEAPCIAAYRCERNGHMGRTWCCKGI